MKKAKRPRCPSLLYDQRCTLVTVITEQPKDTATAEYSTHRCRVCNNIVLLDQATVCRAIIAGEQFVCPRGHPIRLGLADKAIREQAQRMRRTKGFRRLNEQLNQPHFYQRDDGHLAPCLPARAGSFSIHIAAKLERSPLWVMMQRWLARMAPTGGLPDGVVWPVGYDTPEAIAAAAGEVAGIVFNTASDLSYIAQHYRMLTGVPMPAPTPKG